MIALVQFLIKYALLEPFGVTITLNIFGYSLLIIATICLADAGYIINDIYDVDTDSVNKPDKVIVGKTISEKTANSLFITFNIVGVALGFYLSHLIGRNGFFTLFVIVSALLYIYASYLKQVLLVGNIVISLLVSFSIIIVGLFELIPVMTPQNQETQITFLKIILDYAIFAFIINFIREIVKDIEDIDGDYKAGMNTLPIAIGRERVAKIVFILLLIPLFGVVYYVIINLYKQLFLVGYFLLFVIAPLIYILIKSYTAETKREFHVLSNLLKLVMIFGMLSLLLYKYFLLN
jgi:4-hydroxybenzoate polyprenyltransferase